MSKMKKVRKVISAMMVAALSITMLAGCGGEKVTGSVATDGSTSMEKVIGALGEAFQNETGINFTYNPTGSGSGIKAVQEGRCDIGLSSRALKDAEATPVASEEYIFLCEDELEELLRRKKEEKQNEQKEK